MSLRLSRTAIAMLLGLVSLAAQVRPVSQPIRPIPIADVTLLDGFHFDDKMADRRVSAQTCTETGVERKSHDRFQASGDAKHLDLLEHALYNGGISRVSPACRPTPRARTIAEFPGLVYAHDGTTLFVALFVASEATMRLGTVSVRVTQRTHYPWEGDIELRIEPDRRSTFTVAVRVPGWARGQPVGGDLYRFHEPDVPAPTLIVNGQTVRVTFDRGFARVTREWRTGDVMHIHLPMPVHRVLAHPSVEALRGRAALQRGPLVYAFDQAEHARPLADRVVPLDTAFAHTFRNDLLGGVEVLSGPDLLAAPFLASSDRGRGPLVLWLRYR